MHDARCVKVTQLLTEHHDLIKSSVEGAFFFFVADRSCLNYIYLNINALTSIIVCNVEKLTQHQIIFCINIYFILTNIMKYICSDDILYIV